MLEGGRGGGENLFGQNPFEQHLSFQGSSLRCMTSILGAATLPGGAAGWQGSGRADANKLFIATFDIGPALPFIHSPL